ncbi:MAG: cyclodeaminase/cyclohydrolase family protein [Halolamina sp.]|uniref:cyclodeaminase/cyclohydrolase family protein n=1 Tax=Halolamina sp. TaxID=1940283 RepID=UPI002FC2836E
MPYTEQSIGEFLAAVGSEDVAPAGGTAVAVVGAIGASLCEMACVHSMDGAASAAEGSGLADVRALLGTQRSTLMGLARADADVVESLFAADADRTSQSEMKRAAGIPLAIAERCLTVVDLAVTVTEEGDSDATADARMGAVLAAGALRASLLAVRHNLPWIEDRSFVAGTRRRVAELEAAVARSLKDATSDVDATQS